MRTYAEKSAAFRALHERPGTFVIPNPWDAGTARLLATPGFEALAAFLKGAREMKERGSFTYMRDTVPAAELRQAFAAWL